MICKSSRKSQRLKRYGTWDMFNAILIGKCELHSIYTTMNQNTCIRSLINNNIERRGKGQRLERFMTYDIFH